MHTHVTNLPSITTFTDFVLQNRLYRNLDISTRKILKEEIIERTTLRINQEIADSLSPTQLQEFELMVNNYASQEAIQRFIQKSVPDLHGIIVSALHDIQAHYIPQ